jgi:hypothetical protein
MNSVDKSRSPVYRQLEAYEETWTGDHKQAMACRDWEDAIAVGINIFRMLAEREQAWREQVFRGVTDFTADDNLDHQARFGSWLATTKDVLAGALPELEKRFGIVQGAVELRRCVELAETILREWQPPRLSRAVGLREMTLSPEAARELDHILAEARSLPTETVPGSPLREISAEEFLRRKRPPPA